MKTPALSLLISCLATTSLAAPQCHVAPEKRQIIEAVLCGQNSADIPYRQFGAGCFGRSVEKRLEDSAVQIFLYRVCGDDAFADELEAATVRAMEFMEVLSVCVSERVNIAQVMSERTKFVAQKGASLTCTAEQQAHLNQRRPVFQAMIVQSKDAGIIFQIMGRLGVRLGEDGSLYDR